MNPDYAGAADFLQKILVFVGLLVALAGALSFQLVTMEPPKTTSRRLIWARRLGIFASLTSTVSLIVAGSVCYWATYGLSAKALGIAGALTENQKVDLQTSYVVLNLSFLLGSFALLCSIALLGFFHSIWRGYLSLGIGTVGLVLFIWVGFTLSSLAH